MGGTVITCLIMNFLTFFYTDIFGLTRRLSARCLLPCAYLTRFLTLSAGVIADRTAKPMGRCPWQLWWHSYWHHRRADLHRT
ncbi:hypothetical protein KIF59_09795 [Enterobacter cloacae subsp. cloacae]|nr:hypothetical protein [Enterobacter cloacae subsp. cloacae]